MRRPAEDTGAPSGARTAEVFAVFLGLGLASFGGPIAHIGYFRRAFVERHRWIDEAGFAQLVALCQFLPGPASSQLGFALGLRRAGAWGGLAAFVGFTLPSALLLIGFARATAWLGTGQGAAVLQALKWVAAVVVTHGVVTMARVLTPDLRRASIALGVLAWLLVVGAPWAQLVGIAAGALVGFVACRALPIPAASPVLPRASSTRRGSLLLLAAFALLLLAALAAGDTANAFNVVAAFYRAGALVFGGGHVVLPLLQAATVDTGWVDADTFLAGYGAAQAIPGPMFTFAGYLGAQIDAGMPSPLLAMLCLAAIFLPGFLLLAAALPWWDRVLARRGAAAAVAGVNAAVVGLLAAALIDPVLPAAVDDAVDALVVIVATACLLHWRINVLWIVAGCVALSLARHAGG